MPHSITPMPHVHELVIELTTFLVKLSNQQPSMCLVFDSFIRLFQMRSSMLQQVILTAF